MTTDWKSQGDKWIAEMTGEPKSTAIATLAADDTVDRIAKEIGKMVAAHIEVQYSEATKSVAWKSCARSIEGVVRNSVKSAGRAAENGQVDEWLNRKRRERLQNVKAWRDIRASEKQQTADALSELAKTDEELL